MRAATITALNVYPVKSCRGTSLERAAIGATGVEGDRRWLIVTDAGRFLTQRELPRLALIVPTLTERGLSLAAPDMASLRVSNEPNGASIQVTIWSDRCAALDMGAEAAGWLTEFLKRPVRLVRFDPRGARPSDPQWTAGAEALNEFSDGFPLLAISQASLDDLNRRLEIPLPMNRFRPNIVLGGLQPYDEDRIRELADGNVRLRIVKPCTRCKITTTDQATAAITSEEPLKTLRTYRWSRELRGVAFGQNAIVVSGVGFQLHVGQRLEIEWQ